jgi:DNA-binding transcriptional ArsR family regulator
MTTIQWNSGTAYDFFISLFVLHHAADFGLRPYWAAGVRQRLSDSHRDILERVASYAPPPLDWISSLMEPKDAMPVLHRAAELAPATRFHALTLPGDIHPQVMETLERISKHGSATTVEKDMLLHTLLLRNKYIKPAGLDQLLKDWKSLEKSSEQLLAALHDYYNAFFIEEETRIRPALQTGLERARGLASRLPLMVLVEELSHGVHFEDVDSAEHLTLVPSYWSSPFVFHTHPAVSTALIVFGCRPEFQSVAPGAETPDLLIIGLKTLADPTRLRILRHLTGQSLTPTQLSRLLRLRLPTVLHHLDALRLAGLVTIRVSETGEKRYTPREKALNVLFLSVKDFLKKQG